MTRRALVFLLGLAVLATPLLLRAPSPAGAPTVAPAGPTSAIVVVVDDMDDFTCADADLYLPKSSTWLSEQGRCFEDATTASPVCCPARAMLMTGQLPHNNGVRRQNEASRLVGTDTVQHDLSEAGVATYGTGKFLNGLDTASLTTGEFDSGFASTDFWNHYDYLTYDLIDDDGHRYTPSDQMHTTVRTGMNLRQFVSEQAEEGGPFYAYGAFLAPHEQTGRGEAKLPQPTAANAGRAVPPFAFRPEKDTRDKLLPFRGRLDHELPYYRAKQATRVRALYDVDDQVAALFRVLEAEDLLDTTAVIFTSDNGYALGENGWEGKAVPYPSSVNVPLLAYLPPGVGKPGRDTRPVDLVDIAPTLYDVFDVTPGHVVDGHSLLGDHVRTRGRVLEFANERSALVLRESGHSPFRVPTWAMLRIGDRALVQYYRAGRVMAREYYEDPGMQRNLLWSELTRDQKPSWKQVRDMVRALKAMRTCAGTTEQGSPHPCP
ncbi:MAG: sulfatase-like hydrolase/transferase [Actinomycetota bacterium]|nr:sulfatase-like hydrolase/transferase [Actinomycetota bacterium]